MNEIRHHRQLAEKADYLFHTLPDVLKNGTVTGGAEHIEYIEAMIEMYAQMSAVNTLVGILGYIPNVQMN